MKIKKSGQFGTKVEATIVDIYQSTTFRFDNKPGFKVVAQYGNHKYVSEDIYTDIYYALDIGDKIDLYIDETNHSKYLIDIDSILEKDYKVLKPPINKKRGYKFFGLGILIFIFSILIFECSSKCNWSNEAQAGIFFIIIASFLIWLLIIRVIKQNERKKLNQELEQFGTKVEATVLLEFMISRNNIAELPEFYYRIVAKYNKETFLSDEYLNSLANVIKKGDKIDIYLDDMDHSKYYMVLPKKRIR